MRLGASARNPDGRLAFCHVIDGHHSNLTERRFRWSRRGNLVLQWIWMPVNNAVGRGDGYWRDAGKRDTERVLKCIEDYQMTLPSLKGNG